MTLHVKLGAVTETVSRRLQSHGSSKSVILRPGCASLEGDAQLECEPASTRCLRTNGMNRSH